MCPDSKIATDFYLSSLSGYNRLSKEIWCEGTFRKDFSYASQREFTGGSETSLFMSFIFGAFWLSFFDNIGELLHFLRRSQEITFQRRSTTKITFPGSGELPVIFLLSD